MALAGRRWAVVEDVAEVAAAAAAMFLDAAHAKGGVGSRPDRAGQRAPEARPAGAAVIFGGGREERERAAGAGVGAAALFLVEGRCVGALGPFLGATAFELVRVYAAAAVADAWQMILGGVLLLVILFAPGGVWGILSSKLKGRGA